MGELAVRMTLAVLGTWVVFGFLRGLIWPLLPDWVRTLVIPAAAAGVLSIPWPLAREALAVAGIVALIRTLTTPALDPEALPQMVFPTPSRRFGRPKGLL